MSKKLFALLFVFILPLTAFADPTGFVVTPSSAENPDDITYSFSNPEELPWNISVYDSNGDLYATTYTQTNPGNMGNSGGSYFTTDLDGSSFVDPAWDPDVYTLILNDNGCFPYPATLAEMTGSCVVWGNDTGEITAPEEEPVATSTASTTIEYINNPNQDLFNGFILFMIGFFGMSWLFAKKR